MKIQAYAKVNLALDVVRKQNNGYHELDMIMVPIDLHDVLEVHLANKDGIACDAMELACDESNTIYKAMVEMRKHYTIKECFDVVLTKNIPMQAGLAGGSADAAAMLHAINGLCKINASNEELATIGLKIGADVPFCIYNKSARVRGIGEKLEFIEFPFDRSILLVKPNTGVNTKEAFQALDINHLIHPNIDSIASKILRQDESFIFDIGNSLEDVSCTLNNDIRLCLDEAALYPIQKAMMSGSGSCVMVFASPKDSFELIRKAMKRSYEFVEVVNIRR